MLKPILSKSRCCKAVPAPYGEHLVVDYYTITRSGFGGADGWKFDRQTIVKIKLRAAALAAIEGILNAPPKIYRGR